MGYCLFYESMLDTVLYARDKWLVGGVVSGFGDGLATEASPIAMLSYIMFYCKCA